MHCLNCRSKMRFLQNRCPHCGQEASPYVHLPGVLLGVIGCLIGFTFFLMWGAFVGGLIGIVIYCVASRRLAPFAGTPSM